MIYVLESKLHSLISYISYAADGGWGLDFFKGVMLDVPRNSNDLYIEAEGLKTTLPDYFEVQGVPVVSKKFIAVLEGASIDNFQAFPVDVRFENGTMSGHFILNVIGRLKCFDQPQSKLSKFGPSIARIFSLKLLKDAVFDSCIFRAREYQEVIFIQENVKTAIEKANISGCEIRIADGWSDAHRF